MIKGKLYVKNLFFFFLGWVFSRCWSMGFHRNSNVIARATSDAIFFQTGVSQKFLGGKLVKFRKRKQ